MVYRYGRSHKVELEIKSKPKFSSTQFIRAAYEGHLRFHNKGYDYIVYSNELYNGDKTGGYTEHHGVYVVKNKKVLAKLTCKKTYSHMKGIDNTGNDVLKETYIGYL